MTVVLDPETHACFAFPTRASRARLLTRAIVATPAFDRLVAAMKVDATQLLEEIAPVVPRTFGELHDHCDANMLGDEAPLHQWLSENLGFPGTDNVFCGVFNAAQDAVHEWLKEGAR